MLLLNETKKMSWIFYQKKRLRKKTFLIDPESIQAYRNQKIAMF